MPRWFSGMPGTMIPERVLWVKATQSNSQGNCVEMARLAQDAFALRNSTQRNGPVLVFTRAEMVAFIGGAVQGDFNGLLD